MPADMLPLAIKFPSEYFDAKATLECGQIFRYERLKENSYLVNSLDKQCLVETLGEYTYIYAFDKDYFFNFFDLDTDYGKIVSRLSGYPELKAATQSGKGIRILRQDLVETVISFIISANNNIPRIKKIISRLCRQFGEEKEGHYAFPSLGKMYAMDFSDWQSIGAGFRDKYLFSTARALYETDILAELALKRGEDAQKSLCSLSGVGPKVADCISLFGLHDLSVFPVDTWIFKTCRTEELNTAAKVRAFYSQRYGEHAGLAQQYVFYAAKQAGAKE